MPTLELDLTPEEFQQLPRHAAFRYEYRGGKAVLTPRPCHFHAILDLKPSETVADAGIEPINEQDFSDLIGLFATAFRGTQPFASLDDRTRQEAARRALDRTRMGGDGVWAPWASYIARDDNTTIGAILITLLPDSHALERSKYGWADVAFGNATNHGLGRPHLTWVFVSPLHARQGIGMDLLRHSANSLLRMGYSRLLSTFMAGNESSMLWHWRHGFRLLSPSPEESTRTAQEKPIPQAGEGFVD
jgi:GNAT superfamily N-acetyltransferase